MSEETNQTAADLALTTEKKVTQSPSYTVKYNGREFDMPLDELLVSAQKGLNYDHVVSERDRLRNEVERLTPKPDPVKDGFRQLFAQYPELKEIPDEILDTVAKGTAPLDAYRDYLNRELAMEVEEFKNRERNTAASVGSMKDDAPQGAGDSFIYGLFDGV